MFNANANKKNPGGIDAQAIAQTVINKVKEERSKMAKINIMLLGKTGVGKSTLVNSMFGSEVSGVGIGKPVTNSIEKYDIPDSPLVIYDTPGLELGGENSKEKLLNDVHKLISEGINTGDMDKVIHCILYCVSASSHRFENSEKEFVSKFLDTTSKYRVPVIMVLTQAFNRNDSYELAKAIREENLNIVQIVPVLAQDYRINQQYFVPAYGLDYLVNVIMTVIPEQVKDSFSAVQMVDIRLKQKKAHAIIAASAATAAGIAAVPIPFSDAVALVPEQVLMLSAITAAFGLDVQKSTIIAVISSTIGTAGATVLGKSLFTGLLKLIPGVGYVAGGAISAGVASAVTVALGEAYVAVMSKVAKGEMSMSDINGRKGKKFMNDTFKNVFKFSTKNQQQAQPDIQPQPQPQPQPYPGGYQNRKQ